MHCRITSVRDLFFFFGESHQVHTCKRASWWRIVSPFGDSLSFACAKESKQRKAHPGASFLRFATEYPAVLTAAGRLRNSQSPMKPGFAQTVLADSPRPQLRSSATLRGPNTDTPTPRECETRFPWHTFGFLAFGAPVGDAEKRSVLRGSRRGLSEQGAALPILASSAGARIFVNEGREHRRAATERSEGAVPSGVAFLWYLSLAKQRKVLAERRNNEPKGKSFA
jgi:hypothetical protein